MTSWKTGGAFVSGDRPATKKALREAWHGDRSNVIFQYFDPYGASSFNALNLDARGGVSGAIDRETVLHVHGPDPETSRKWIATLEWSAKAYRNSGDGWILT